MREAEIETYGCSMNQGASEKIAGLLTGAGYSIRKDARILIINTCTVKTPTERKIRKRLSSLKGAGKRIIICGCLPLANPEIVEDYPEHSFLGTNIEDVVEAVEKAHDGKRIVKIEKGRFPLNGPCIRKNPVVAIVPISEGCLGSCSYCIVKRARGDLKSYPPESIADEIKSAVSSGAKEVWLTSQDCGAYGSDIGSSLPELLEKVCGIEGEFMVRAGMMNPNHAKKNLEELIDAYKHEKIYKFLHVPVQSGDDEVLKDMNRHYSVADFIAVIDAFRKDIPGITISTDVIVGYPTEDEDAFKKTTALLKRTRPDVLNISRFWPRPRTPAERLRQLPGRVTNQRSRIVASLFKGIAAERNGRWVGWEGRVLVSERGKKGTFAARNQAYKTIILRSRKGLLGEFVNARVTKSHGFYLEGECA